MSEEFSESQIQNIQRVKNSLQNRLHDKLGSMDPRIQVLVKYGGIVTGGVSASLFWHDEPNDYDIYFKNEASRDEFQKLLIDPIIQDSIADVNPNYGVETLINGKLVTSHAVTFKNNVQIILMHTSNARETFDFIHTMPWYDCDDRKYYISQSQYDAITTKTLIQNPHPNATKQTQKRMQKFIDRGWRI